MRNRPIVVLVCIYIMGLIWVLIWQPELGEKLFAWDYKEAKQKEKYESETAIEGLVLSVQKKQDEGRARLKLDDGMQCVLVLTQEQTLDMKAGSRIRIKGEIWWPEAATNPGQWDGLWYARIQNIGFYVRVADWTCLQEEYNSWYEGMDRIRRWISKQIDNRWNTNHAQILKAMLIGEKGELEEVTSKLFRQGGISHIIAISGLHLTILGEILERILKKFQKPKSVKLEITAFLWIYVFLTGASVSTLRAAIMMSIQTIALMAGREEDPPTSLALTAGLLLVYQPLYILDAGFCLSFGALLGMKYGSIVLMSMRGIPYRVRRMLAPSAGIMLATIPISLWFFSEASIYGFILNFWVVPAMDVVLMGSLVSLGLSVLHPALGQGLATLVDHLLFSFQKGSEGVSILPGAQMRGKPELYQMMIIYGLWILLYYYYHKKKEQRNKCFFSIIGLVCGMILLFRPLNWRVMYLDVGQGDCAVIEWKQHVFIVDAGPKYEEVLKPYLYARGITRIDGVLLSHADWDHIEGLLALSQDPDFSIDRLWVGESRESEHQILLESNIERNGGVVQRVSAGYSFKTEGFCVTVLSPKQNAEHIDSNEDALVALIEVDNRFFFFPGDIGENTEKKILHELQDVDVLKVAHHGSRYSTGMDLLERIRPELAVISCGRDNRYGHPHEETVSRIEEQEIEWYSTANCGAIWVEENFGRLECSQYINR